MPWPVHPNGLLGAQGDNDSYRIERSLRFNSADSAFLNRTPSSATSRTVWTFSCWVKRGLLNSNYTIFSAGTSANTKIAFEENNIANGDGLRVFDWDGASFNGHKITTALFRDPSAWYHIVVSWNTAEAAADRIKIYVNGSQVTSFSTNTNAGTGPTSVNNNVLHRIGQRSDQASGYFNGYLTEIHLIDGQALTPSSFGETDAITGRWKAKAYSGTYGTNGFYLKFADNSGTTATTLGKDSSPNGNNWTPNNFSVTVGAGNDSLVDSPTNYGTDTGVGGEVRGNYCTLNPINRNTTATLSNGNLDFETATSGHNAIGTIGMSSGKWYWEARSNFGATEVRATVYSTFPSTYAAFATNSVDVGFRFDADAGTLDYTTNGSTWVSLRTGLTVGPYFPFFNNNGTTSKTISVNFGQRPFSYAAPAGYKALCTTNLPQPTIQKPSSAMDVVTYTGNGSARSITGLGFSPDLVWIKGRSGATDHAIYDSVRGVQLDLGSNLTTDETTQTQGLTAFNSDGFSIGTLAKINTNAATYVAWAWDRAAIDGVDIVSYTGNGANRTIAHNLGVAPKMIIVKARTTAGTDQGWPVYHASLTDSSYVLLNSTAATTLGADYWNLASPTASVFSLGTNAAVNANNDTYIAYLFAEVEGFSRFGSYTGNGSADGPFVWCGFRPRWIIMKMTTSLGDWYIVDTARDTVNVVQLGLEAASTSSRAEIINNYCDILSNGFKLRFSGAQVNGTGGGGGYIFAAFAESPFKYARAR